MRVLHTDRAEQVSVSIDGREYVIARARLGLYLELERFYLTRDIRGYLAAAGVETDAGTSGVDAFIAFAAVAEMNRPPVDLPIMRDTPRRNSHGQPPPWNYAGRRAVAYIHVLAAAYHWTRADILNMHVDEFFAHVQEILVDQQMEREFYYSLSEIAYPYDRNADAGIFKPLTRPTWMTPTVQDYIKQSKYKPPPKWMMPIGAILGAKDLLH